VSSQTLSVHHTAHTQPVEQDGLGEQVLGRGLLDLVILVNLTVALDPVIVATIVGAKVAENFKNDADDV